MVLGKTVQFGLAIIVLGIIGMVGVNILEKTSDKTALSDNEAATGTITFTGNVSQNETVNFTVNASYVVNFAFNHSNISGIPEGYNYINITGSYNGSDVAAYNLTVAINSNATLAAILTATNGTNATIVTYDTTGTAGNAIQTTETVTNASWASSTLTGGAVIDTFYNASLDVAETVETGYDYMPFVLLAIAAGLVITAIFIGIPIKF